MHFVLEYSSASRMICVACLLHVCCLSVACALYAVGLANFFSAAVASVSIWLAE